MDDPVAIGEPSYRIQTINRVPILEVTETVNRKNHYTRDDLLRQRAYFEEMVAKGQTGLDAVDAKLAQFPDEKPA